MRIVVTSFLCMFTLMISGQQPMRSDLLRLFHTAHVAQTQGEKDVAIEAYINILKLSPGLPDVYLQLGDLYSQDVLNESSLNKAVICYTQYLKLTSEAEDASSVEKKIISLQDMIKNLEQDEEYTMISDSTEEVDEKQEVASQNVETPVVTAYDEALLGRWASLSMADNGREDWILDFVVQDGLLQLELNDNSYMARNKSFAEAGHLSASGIVKDGDYSFTFRINKEERISNNRGNIKRNNLSSILGDLFDIDIDELFGEQTNTKQEMEQDGGSELKKHEFLYTFHLKDNGGHLIGDFVNSIYDVTKERKLLSEDTYEIELVKVPDDYEGFTYNAITNDQKLSAELQDLFNQRRDEMTVDVSAVNDLGFMYESGIGVKRNVKMAVSCFKEASLKGNLYGMLNMARLYQSGLGVERNMVKAEELYQKAFDAGYTDAMVLCGDAYLQGSSASGADYQKALSCYEKARLKRNPAAACQLGLMYGEGWGVEQDTARAVNYYEEAINMQYAEAMLDMGGFYREGKMVEKNYTKALELLLKAADKGNARAMYELSEMYLKGIGVKPDFAVSKEWLLKSMKAKDEAFTGFSTIKDKVVSILHNQ